METELVPSLSPGNTQIFLPEPKPLHCECGVSMRWRWVDRIENPLTGIPFDWTNKWAHPGKLCEKCLEKREAEIQKEEKAREEKMRLLRIEQLNNRITLEMGGGRTANWNFSSFLVENDTQAKALVSAKKAANGDGNLYLWGKHTGTGKSHLAGASYRHAVLTGNAWGGFWKPSSLLRYMRILDSDEQEKRVKKLIVSPILVIDDLGIGNVTDFSLQIFYDIVDGRWMKEMNGMIITANLSLDDLAKKLDDDRLPSRIAGMCDVVELTGKDRRIDK